MTKTKRTVIIVSMILVLVTAACLNLVLLKDNSDTATDDATATGDFFATSRQIRETTRAEEKAALDEILAMEGTEYESQRKSALERKMKLIELMEKEMIIESLIKAKGYEDVYVNLGIYSDNVNVIVRKDAITREDTAVIYSIIVAQTGIKPEFIKFIES